MVNDNSLSDSVLIQIGVLEKDIKDLEDILSHLEHSGESGRGYDRQIANIKNQIQQKTKQIQQFKRSINMNDSMEQLAMIGITQDAESIPNEKIMDILRLRYNKVFSEEKTEQELLKVGVKPEVAKRLSKNPGMFTKSDFNDADPSQEIRNEYIQEIYKLEKEMARLYRMGQGAQAAKIDQQIKKLRKELRELNTKDDDATEHGSIETYGKEKETETMPLEKDPIQAQDSDVNYKGWRIVTKPDPRKGFSGYEAEIIPPKWSRPYDGTANHKLESEAMAEAKKLVDYYIKEGVGVKDEEPTNAVKDSYEILKLSGFIS